MKNLHLQREFKGKRITPQLHAPVVARAPTAAKHMRHTPHVGSSFGPPAAVRVHVQRKHAAGMCSELPALFTCEGVVMMLEVAAAAASASSSNSSISSQHAAEMTNATSSCCPPVPAPASHCHTATSPEARPTHTQGGSDDDWLQVAVSTHAPAAANACHLHSTALTTSSRLPMRVCVRNVKQSTCVTKPSLRAM